MTTAELKRAGATEASIKPATVWGFECPICGLNTPFSDCTPSYQHVCSGSIPAEHMEMSGKELRNAHDAVAMATVAYVRHDRSTTDSLVALGSALEACLQFINATTLKAVQKDAIMLTIYAALRRIP